jgi:hypothetical protein
MAGDRVEKQLEHLKSLRAGGVSEASTKELRKALSDRVNVVSAKAAGIADEWQLKALIPDLKAAFGRMLDAPETDSQCWGKNAISKALKDLGLAESALFLHGLMHFQWESTWGGKTDAATVLRATCALALVQCTDLPRHETLRYLVNAATERDAGVRSDAVRALEQMSGNEVILLLRLKARAGDQEVSVTGQVLDSLLHLEGPAAVPFVSEFLHRASEELIEEAALALGASRLPEAVAALCATWSERRPGGAALLRAISASRQDSALEFLLQQIRTARLRVAEDALHALELHQESENIVKRIEQAIAGRKDLQGLFEQVFRRQ